MPLRLELRTSGIWQTTSAVLARDGRCLCVDPAYFPRELDELASLVAGCGSLEALVFTHGHWDHVLGAMAFPAAPLWCSARLAEAIASNDAAAAKNLAEARDFDGRWYVAREAPYRWPAQVRGLRDGERIESCVGPLRAFELTGHSADGLGLLVEEERLLFVGDHLSPCEIPFVENLQAYRQTLGRLMKLLASEVRTVIPGHGPPLGAAAALEIAEADAAYLDELALLAARGDDLGMQEVALPRAQEVPGMAEHHLENCKKAQAQR